MDKKIKNECSKISSTVKLLTVTASMVTGVTCNAFGMEWVLGGIGSIVSNVVTGSMRSVSESAVGYLDKEKKTEDLFNEGIANSKREEAMKATTQAFDSVRLGLRELGVISNAQLAEKVDNNSNVKSYYTAFQTWYTKYRLGFLVLDYTDAFCDLCDSSIKEIKLLIPKVDPIVRVDESKVRSDQAYFEGFINEINKKKEQIGAKLYLAYRYNRGGGPRDRWVKHSQTGHDRFHKWGVWWFKEPSEYSFEEVSENILQSNLAQDIIIYNIREAYRATIKVLSAQSVICSNDPQTSSELLDEYFETFSKLYADRPLSPCHLSNLIFNDEEPKVRLEKTPSTSTVSSPSGVKVPVKGKTVPRTVSQSISVPTPKGVVTPKRTSHDFSVSSSLGSSRNSVPKEGLMRKIVQEEESMSEDLDNEEGILREGGQDEDVDDGEKETVELTVKSADVKERKSNLFPSSVTSPEAFPKSVSGSVPKTFPVIDSSKSISNPMPQSISNPLPKAISNPMPQAISDTTPKPFAVLALPPSVSSAGGGSFFDDLEEDYPGEDYQGEDNQGEDGSQEGDDATHY